VGAFIKRIIRKLQRRGTTGPIKIDIRKAVLESWAGLSQLRIVFKSGFHNRGTEPSTYVIESQLRIISVIL
jgi:hypothetical protein